ncbi:MAG: Zn-dependent oligopeptidase [Elusimicrobia bacterium]|nr:Zn-dependent oligopeptidase [Elusimicrobiota bacterium]
MKDRGHAAARLTTLLLATLLALPSAARAQAVVAGAAGRAPVVRVPVIAAPAYQPSPALGGAAALPLGAAGLPQVPDWSLDARQMKEAYKAAEVRMLRTADAVAAIPAESRTFENTALALERAESDFQDAMLPLRFLSEVSPDAKVRRMADAIERRTSRMFQSYGDRSDLHRAYQEVAAKGLELGGLEKKLLDDALRGFERRGMNLPRESRDKLNRISRRLSDLSQQFSRNVSGIFEGIEVTREQLDGLPEDYVKGLEAAPEGRYRVTLDYPTFFPFMKYAKDAALRKELYLKFENKAAEANLPILGETLALRREESLLLGRQDFAHLVIEERMAKTPEKVKTFLERIKDLLKGPAEAEYQALLETKRQDDPAAESVPGWDRSYYANKLKQKLFSFDSEEVRQYFPVEQVIKGTLEVYQELLGVRFRELASDAWHKDARLFEVIDAASGRSVAYFYLDLHPRENKYGHAAQFTLRKGRALPDGSYQKPVGAVVANFSKPTPDKPALLTLGEVETLFHELGHCMHETLTQVKLGSYAGASVAWDFVETPSQMMENFVWQPEVLRRISGHYQDPSRKLPEELLKKMVAARNFLAATSHLWNAALAAVDLAYHTLTGPFDPAAVYREVFEAFGLKVIEPGTHPEAAFDHIMGGYAAGYYGYIWSEVYAQDIFSVFKKAGVLSPEVGMRYRKAILERGSSVDEGRLLRDFLGREPDEKAFLEGMGIKTSPRARRPGFAWYKPWTWFGFLLKS